MKRCKHNWYFEHTIYQGPRGEKDNRCAVHRQCQKCGQHQMALTTRWRKPYKGYQLSDLRNNTRTQ